MGLTEFGEKLELRSEIELAVPRASAWHALMDFAQHQRWNPFWSNVRGHVEKDSRVDLQLTPPGGTSISIRRRVQHFEREICLEWRGAYGWGWLLRSEQFFRLSELSNAHTRLVVGENLRGPGVTSKGELMMNIARGQALMNQALKRFVESQR